MPVSQVCRAGQTEAKDGFEHGYSNMYFGTDTFVGRAVNEDGTEGGFIKNFEHGGGAVGQKVGQNSFGIFKMLI